MDQKHITVSNHITVYEKKEKPFNLFEEDSNPKKGGPHYISQNVRDKYLANNNRVSNSSNYQEYV